MLGMGIGEILIVAIVAVIVLGPDKLPSAMVNIAKFFKLFKQTINGAKSTFEQEIKIAELKEDAKKYKDSLTGSIDGVRKKLVICMIRDQNFGYQKKSKKKYIACCFVCGCSSEKVFTQINQYFFQDTFF